MSMTTTTERPLAAVSMGAQQFNMENAIRFAELMAKAKLVPEHLQNKPGDCLLVIEQAHRWGMSPFAVAQCTSVVHGRLMFEGKLVAAAVQSSGILDGRLAYEFSGDGDDRTCVVSGVVRGESKPRTISVVLRDVKTFDKNGKPNQSFVKQPDQQLVYGGSRVWARRHAPEVMLGVYAPEEFDQQPTHGGPIVAEVVQTETRQETPHDPQTGEVTERRATWREKLDELERDLNACRSPADVDAVMAEDRVQKMLDHAVNGNKKRLDDMITKAQYRDFSALPSEQDQAA